MNDVETIRIRPSRGWRAVNLFELWRFRDLLWSLALRDIKLRYRQTALGVVWVVLGPLLSAGIFSFIFGNVADLPTGNDIPYFVFSYSGMIGWTLFSATVGKVTGAMVSNSNLVTKIYFPRLVLPFSTLAGTILNLIIAMSVMAVMWITTVANPSIRTLTLPFWMLILLATAMGLGLVAAAVQVTYRDVGQIMPTIVSLLLYVSPVAYAVQAIPAQYRDLYSLNPLVGALNGFRWSLGTTDDISLRYTAVSVVVAVVFMTIGLLAFVRMERNFADVV